MAPHGLILSGNEAIPSMMLFRLLLGLFEPILYAFLMQIRPQGSGPRKFDIFSIFPIGLFRLIWSLSSLVAALSADPWMLGLLLLSVTKQKKRVDSIFWDFEGFEQFLCLIN